MNKTLKGKKIIITAGPVWVPVDKVRVMTNIFGGSLGYIISKEAIRLGAEVLLLMGPGRACFKGNEGFDLIKFKTYDEIYNLLKNEVSSKKYDILIHSAAIPDYVPKTTKNNKIKSGKKELIIKFKPTIKIVDQVKKWDPNIFLVKFKLEVNKNEKELTNIAYKSMIHSNADLMVANELNKISSNHRAYIIDRNFNYMECQKKVKIARKLLEIIKNKI
jgi:phosphopantothenoylcysteine synthetase/decarboxylase